MQVVRSAFWGCFDGGRGRDVGVEVQAPLLSSSITAINQPKLSSRGALLVVWEAGGKWGRGIALKKDHCFPRGNPPSCAAQGGVVVEKFLWLGESTASGACGRNMRSFQVVCGGKRAGKAKTRI